MSKLTQEQMQADWKATKNIADFQELLNGETDGGRYRILSRLLSDEFEKLKKPQAKIPMSARVAPNPIIEDLGNPLMGILLGALMVSVSVGGLFLWDNHQGGPDANATALINQE